MEINYTSNKLVNNIFSRPQNFIFILYAYFIGKNTIKEVL